MTTLVSSHIFQIQLLKKVKTGEPSISFHHTLTHSELTLFFFTNGFEALKLLLKPSLTNKEV